MTDAPQALIAEITHRCPLHCVYCSNPLEMQASGQELTTEQWKDVIRQAGAMGCWHLHFTGGEPLLRVDLELLILAGRQAGLYVNLITSGLGLSRERLRQFVDAGLDHIQLSFQDSQAESANTFAGTKAHAQKLRVAEWIREHRIAFTVNMVIHRSNIDRLAEMIDFAEQLRPDKLEIANVQYYGWALRNRAMLLPTRDQVHASLPVIEAARTRFSGRMRVDYVLPDYFAKFPKPCMGGWGRSLLLIDPAGRAMPCHSASVIPGLCFPTATREPLSVIWESSEVFQRFRGEEWMQEPCRSCERRSIDFGGCHCQAMLIAQNADAADPVCSLSEHRPLIDQIIAENSTLATEPSWVYRIDPAR